MASSKRHNFRFWLGRSLFIGFLLQGLTGCDPTGKLRPAAGDAFPLTLLDQMTRVGGQEFDLQGKTLLINFWATWCAPCREEMPALQKLSEDLDPRHYAVIGISVDRDINLAREFLLQYEIRFANFQDNESRSAVELLAIETFPETFIVSPQGIIEKRIGEALSPDFTITGKPDEIGEQWLGNIIDSRVKG